MSFQWQGIQPETFAQANPFLTGLSAVTQYQQQMTALQQAQAQAQMAQQKSQINPQLLQAQLAQAQALPALTQAQTAEQLGRGSLYGSESNRIQAELANPALMMTGPAGIVGQFDLLKRIGSGPLSYTPYSAAQGAQANSGAPNSYPPLPGGLNANSAQAAGIPSTQPLTINPNQLTGGSNNPLNTAANNPMAQYQHWQSNLTTQNTMAKLNAETWNNMQNDASDASAQAVNQQNTLKNFVANYDKSQLKGANGGWLPSTGIESMFSRGLKGIEFQGTDLTPEQLSDTYAKQLVAPTARQMFQNGRLTNMDVSLAQSTKPNRNLDNGTVHNLAPMYDAQNQRTNELQQFIGVAQSLGITNPHIVQNLWNAYQTTRPAVNDAGEVNTKYLNTFRDFLTPQVITQMQLGQPVTPTPVKQDLAAAGTLPSQAGGRIRVISPDGKTGTISTTNLDAALNAGYRRAS